MSEEPRIWECGAERRREAPEWSGAFPRSGAPEALRSVAYRPRIQSYRLRINPGAETNDWDIVLSVFLLDARSLGASICAEMLAQPPKCCSRSTAAQLNEMRFLFCIDFVEINKV